MKKIMKGISVTGNGITPTVYDDQPILTSPIIDKISIVVPMPDENLHGLLVNGLVDHLQDHEHGFVEVKSKGPYVVSVNVQCPDEQGVIGPASPSVLLQATKKELSSRFARVEFNPNNVFAPMNTLQPDAYEYVLDYLDVEMTGLCGMRFFEFLSKGYVTRIDVARNILFRSVEDYMFEVAYARSLQNIFAKSGKNKGHLETMYFGKSSGDQTAIYDKAMEVSDGNADYHSIRIERRLRPKSKKLSVMELWRLSNPFSPVRLYSLAHDNPPLPEGHWDAFKDACRFRGVKNAIKMQPKKFRYALKKVLSEMPVSWWEIPEEDWPDIWSEALSSVWFERVWDYLPMAKAA